MTKLFVTAVATAAIVLGAVPLGRAGATAATSPSPAAGASRIREAAIVCGGNGCNVVQTKAQKRRKFKPLEYTRPLPRAS